MIGLLILIGATVVIGGFLSGEAREHFRTRRVPFALPAPMGRTDGGRDAFAPSVLPVRRARVVIVPAARVRVARIGEERGPDVACRFCGFALSDGDHTSCQEGRFDD